jgi:hypothetical protein
MAQMDDNGVWTKPLAGRTLRVVEVRGGKDAVEKRLVMDG